MRVTQLATMTVAAGVLMTATLAAAQSPAPSGNSDNDGWRTIIYPIHAWLPVFGADVTLPEQPTPPGSGGGCGGITIPSAKTSGNFNGAALAGFRVERARMSIDGDDSLGRPVRLGRDAALRPHGRHDHLQTVRRLQSCAGALRRGRRSQVRPGHDRLDPQLSAGELEAGRLGAASSA